VPVADTAIGELSNACLNYLPGFGKVNIQRVVFAAMQYQCWPKRPTGTKCLVSERNIVDLLETPLEEAVAYRGKFLTLRRDAVRLPDGQRTEREFLLHPGAVAVLALTADRQLVMERQYRYPAGREFIEIPAGKIDPNEAPAVTGERELFEETGYQAARWTFLGTAHPCIGYSNEVIHYFLAEELTENERQLDEGEFLEVLTLPVAEVVAMSLDGRITDSKTIVGLHWLAAYLSGSLKGELLLPAA